MAARPGTIDGQIVRAVYEVVGERPGDAGIPKPYFFGRT